MPSSMKGWFYSNIIDKSAFYSLGIPIINLICHSLQNVTFSMNYCSFLRCVKIKNLSFAALDYVIKYLNV